MEQQYNYKASFSLSSIKNDIKLGFRISVRGHKIRVKQGHNSVIAFPTYSKKFGVLKGHKVHILRLLIIIKL